MRNGDAKRADVLLFAEPGERRLELQRELSALHEHLIAASSLEHALELLAALDIAVVVADASRRDLAVLASAIHGRPGRAVATVVRVAPAGETNGVPELDSGPVETADETVAPAALCARVRLLAESFRKSRRIEHLQEERDRHLHRYQRDLQQLSHAAGHDLQEPLRTISTFVRLLARRHEGSEDAEVQTFTRFALEGVERLHERIVDLREYVAVHVDGRGFGTVDCARAFARAVEDLRDAVSECDARVTHGPLPVLHGDEDQLVQVLRNLIENALKFRRGEARPEVHVDAEPSGGEWQFSVRDNGIGIAPELVGRIFHVFQRLHGRRQYPGNGIGLAICRKVVENHGGRIWVESKPGEGSVFRFTLASTLAHNGHGAIALARPEERSP